MTTMLRGTAQQILKALHLICVGLNLGGTAGVLGLLLLGGKDPTVSTLPLFLFDWVVAPAYYGLLATGIVYSLFTNWGFARYYWVLAKWVLALLLFAGTAFLLAPALAGVGAYSEMPTGEAAARYRTSALFWTAVSTGVLFGIAFISTLKPWGRPRWDWNVPRPVQLGLVLGTAGVAIALGLWSHLLLRERRALPIADRDFRAVPDGVYVGLAHFEFPYRVELIFQGGKLIQARMLANRDSDYARFAAQILPRVIRAQSLQVDAISGATTTSVAILKAAEHALTKTTTRAK